jgi:hypothetical protein
MPKFTVTYSKSGQDPLVWINKLEQSFQFDMQNILNLIAEKTASRMGEIIQDSIKRPPNTGKLAMNIDSEILNSTGGLEIGIGNIAKMNSEVPYWRVLNDGGYLPPSAVGFFGDGNRPIAGASGEKWTDAQGGFKMTPKKVTEPVRYIEISNEELTKHIKRTIDKLMRSPGTNLYPDIT